MLSGKLGRNFSMPRWGWLTVLPCQEGPRVPGGMLGSFQFWTVHLQISLPFISRELQGDFQETGLQSIQEALQTGRSLMTIRTLFKELWRCTLGKERCVFMERIKAPMVASKILKSAEFDSGIKLRCESQTFTNPGLSTLPQVLLCFLSMVLTALPTFSNCAGRTILRKISTVLFYFDAISRQKDLIYSL